jgi:hypothetical protein
VKHSCLLSGFQSLQVYDAQRKAEGPKVVVALAPPVWALKVEKRLAVLALWHCGHAGTTPDDDAKTKRSNVVWHSSHWYSKIGMVHSSGNRQKTLDSLLHGD